MASKSVTGSGSVRVTQGRRRRAAGAPEGSPATDAAPRTNRGGETRLEANTGGCIPGLGSFRSCRMLLDWWSSTMSMEADEILCRRCLAVDGSRAYWTGYAEGEKRNIWGGQAERYTRPHQPSATFGSEYAQWVVRGQGLPQLNVDFLTLVDDLTPRRIDVACDFFGATWSTKAARAKLFDRVLVPCQEVHEGTTRGRCTGVTWYVGARSSMKRICMYDKGMEQRAGLYVDGESCTPIEWQRIELRLADDAACDFWQVYRRDVDESMAMVRGAIAGMVGGLEWANVMPWQSPPVPVPDDAQSLFHVLKQNSRVLVAASDAGLDVMQLARLAQENASRTSRWRCGQSAKSMAEYEGLERVISRALRARSPVVALQEVRG